ncbi:MAG: endonuclease/exonuclease/phosphatase family protein [Acidobacteriota bacterium]
MTNFKFIRAMALGALVLTAAAVHADAADDIVLYAKNATVVSGAWALVNDATAAGGARLANPDAGVAKVGTPLASPATYFELKFTPDAGKAYRLWIRSKAQNDSWTNDSVFVQFSGSRTAGGAAAFRIGTSAATVYSLEEGSGAGESGWGWQDNGYGYGVLGDLIYFDGTAQTIRVQAREDGISIDQIVLSAATYASRAPGSTKNDATILSASGGTPVNPVVPTGTTLRLLQWNTNHGGFARDSVNGAEKIASWIAYMRPDVVTLNEIEKLDYWGNIDQPEVFRNLLQQKTGKTWYYVFAQEFGQWNSNGKGNLILSTYPINWADRYELLRNYDRSVAEASITVNGRNITLMVTHLDPYDLPLRLAQATEVAGWAAAQPQNRILTGDMNAWPDQSSIQFLNTLYYDSWTVAAANGTATSFAGNNGETKNGRIDYIFFSKASSNLVVKSSQVYDTRDSSGNMPSDHRPVLTTFEVR